MKKSEQYLVCAALLPLPAVFDRPPYLTPLVFTLFAAVYLYTREKTVEEAAITPGQRLHFALVYLACAATSLVLAMHSAGRDCELAPWLLTYVLKAIALAFLLKKDMSLPVLFMCEALTDPLLLSGLAPFYLALESFAQRDWLSALAYLAGQYMEAGASAGIALIVAFRSSKALS